MKPIILRLTPRARRDIEKRVAFVARFPSGKPDERRAIHAAFDKFVSTRSGTPSECDAVDQGWS